MSYIKPCPKCGAKPKYIINTNRRTKKSEHGFCCSNIYCSWSYAYSPFNNKDDAIAHWNKKVEEKLYLQKESEKLNRCYCGGKAELIYENWHQLGQGWFVRCESCRRLISATDSKDKAINAWNKSSPIVT